MVAHLLRLRFDLLWGSLRLRGRARTRLLTAFAAVVALTAALCIGVLALGRADGAEAAAVIVVAGAAAMLACAIGPILAGATDPLDPRRFAVFGLSPRSLPHLLLPAGLVSVPVLALIAALVCTAIVWDGHGAHGVLIALAAVLVVVTTVLFTRVSLALGALVFPERRSRELSGLFNLVLIVLVVPVAVFLASLEWGNSVPVPLRAAVDVLSVTPLGAAWALPTVAEDRVAIVLCVAVLTVVVLWAAWTWLARRLLATTEPVGAGRERSGLGWFALLPGTPAGAIAARSLSYWLRDRRYVLNVVVVPIAAVLATLPLLIAGMPPAVVALVPVPIIAVFLGWLPHNDVAYDSTAIWMHLGAGVSGLADRVGRLAPILLIGIPLLAIAVPVSVALHGGWSIAPALVGVAAALFLTGLGLSSIASAAAPYAVARPGDSPFRQPQRHGSSGVLAQSLVMLGTLALGAPVLRWTWLAVEGDLSYVAPAFWGGLGLGTGLLLVGVVVGAAVFDRRGDRLMEFAETA